MGGTGTKVLIIMLTINIFLVLGGFTIVDVDLVGMFQNPGNFVTEILKLGIGIAGAPLALLANAGIPAEIRLLFGLPLTAVYTLAWIQFIRGRPL
ncbi:hypothetical protein [Archaeoglobus sp.]